MTTWGLSQCPTQKHFNNAKYTIEKRAGTRHNSICALKNSAGGNFLLCVKKYYILIMILSLVLFFSMKHFLSCFIEEMLSYFNGMLSDPPDTYFL